MNYEDLVLPDLGLDEQPISLSLWLVKKGGHVTAGEPIVEVLAGAATVDLPCRPTAFWRRSSSRKVNRLPWVSVWQSSRCFEPDSTSPFPS